VCEVGSDELVVRIDIGFGRICTFELITTLMLPALPLTIGPVPLHARTGFPAWTFAETGWTTTPGNKFESTSGTSTEETDRGDESSVLTEMSSDSRDCRESHSSAVISVSSCVVPSPYKHIPYVLGGLFIKTS